MQSTQLEQPRMMFKSAHTPMPMKAAARRPAASSLSSEVSRYVATAARPEKNGARNTHTSRMWMVKCSEFSTQWMRPVGWGIG